MSPFTSFLAELEKIAISHGQWTIPKSRSGRRSMSVMTLLRKEKDGTLTKQAFHEQLPGGLAAGKKPSEFDQKNLAAGRKVESEHTKSPQIATEIAMDHLTEDPGYYHKLRKMEKSSGLVEELLKQRKPGPPLTSCVVNMNKSADLVDSEYETKMRRRLARLSDREGMGGKLAAAATEQANAVYQEVDPKNSTISPTTKFRRGDTPSRDDIAGKSPAEYRQDVSGSTASRGMAPEGYSS